MSEAGGRIEAALRGAPARIEAALRGAPARIEAALRGAPARIEAALRGAPARVGAALRAAPARAGRTRVVAIDGRSGSGKTRLAGLLRAELGAPVVSLEDLYGGWDGLERGIDLLVTEVLEPLAARRAARVPRYDWITRTWEESTPLDPPGLLIVEGVGAGARRAAVFESLVVWLEAPADVRKKRALDRDGETFVPYWDYWAAQEEAMLTREHTPERADVLIDAVNGNVLRSSMP